MSYDDLVQFSHRFKGLTVESRESGKIINDEINNNEEINIDTI